MQKLLENWRKFVLSESLTRSEIEDAISDASFNSAKSSQHRWSPRQPIIDYYFDERLGKWKFQAAIPDGTDDADKWPRVPKDGTWSDQDIGEFLIQVREPIQMNLFKEQSSPRESMTMPNIKELRTFLEDNPEENFTINIDNPVHSYKKFGQDKSYQLPFDYGEWPELINPADDMGWDLIIVPSASGGSSPAQNLKIIGVVKYDGLKKKEMIK